MRFSVLVPMYNVEGFISEAIESVLNQTYGDFELILVNDGSSDNTLEISNKYQASDGRIRIITQKNKGLLQARLTGRRNANGEYIVFLDSDDLLSLNALEKLNETIITTNADVVMYKIAIIGLDGSILLQEKHTLEGKDISHDTIIDIFSSSSLLNSLCGKCVKNSLMKSDFINFEQLGHLNMTEDRLQSLYPLYFSKRNTFLNEYLYKYRTNPESITLKVKQKAMNDSIKTYEVIYKYYKNILSAELLEKMTVYHAMQTFGLYLRWLATNTIKRKEKIAKLKELNNNEITKIDKRKIRGIVNKFIFSSITNSRFLIIDIMVLINKIRIKRQR